MNDLFGSREGAMKEDNTGERKSTPAASVPENQTAVASPGAGTKSTKQNMRFEDAFARLESLVGEMERGELPLEQMLDRFEEGVRLVRHCNEFLSQAQLRVERYVEQKDGHWVLKEEKAKG
jgi:exodeoxyribonuclease VII small subunit